MDSDLSSALGAITGVSAFAISLVALSRAGLANRRAALLMRWIDSTMQVENLGPARAREVTVLVQSEDPSRPRQPMTIAALSNGYTHRLPYPRGLLGSDSIWIDLTWKDDRWRQQSDCVLVSQERTPKPSGSTIPDKHVDAIAVRLGEGVGKALNEVVSRGLRRR